MVINEGPVRNLVKRAKKSYNAIMGNTSGNYDMSVHNEDEAKELLSGTVLNVYKDKFGKDSYQMSYDPDRSYLKFEFSAKRVPNELVDKINPSSGDLYKYVTDYDKGRAVLTMELPVDKSVMKKVYNDTDPKSNNEPEDDPEETQESEPEDTINPDVGVTQDDEEEYQEYEESMMAPTNLTITGKRTLQCDDEGHEIFRELSESMIIREAYYEEVRSKSVYDSDGFTSEYTLYHNTEDDTYLCIFGDRELYTPYDTEPDMEFESEDEAYSWFDTYEGPGVGSTQLELDDDFEDEEFEEESIKLRTESVDDALSATDVVMNLYNEFPEIDFYDERDLSDNLVGLVFDAKKIYKDMDKKKSLEDYLVQHNIDYRFNDGRLLIKAREDETSTESLVESVSADDFDKFDDIIREYMPGSGEGDTMASQAVTAMNKLIFKWYNDGDVYDNTYSLEGWANDLSSYANWLYRYVPDIKWILRGISTCETDEDYEELLMDLANHVLNKKILTELARDTSEDSIYDCDGPFKFAYRDDDDDEYWEDEDDDDDDLEIEEDYWFGGDGKLQDTEPTNPFETKEDEVETADKIDQDKLDLLDKVVDEIDDEESDAQ